ncbi:MAG: helix-turn-helix transcriptional regulator [Chitinophagaceae bacterium]|nr:helix-turn-helix transcriptional regulator [Chitinophagaceae bacterium]
MSKSSRLVLGYPAEYVMDGGLEFIRRQYRTEDFRVYSEKIFMQNLYLLKQQPADHSCLMFGYNYRFLNKDGEYHTLMQKSVMLRSAPDGSPITMLSFAFDITDYKNDSKIIHTVEAISDQGLVPLSKNFYFPHPEDAILSRREIEILKWICDGLSSKEIAGKLHLSLHTVNNHRKNMLQKCNCRNATELLAFSIREGLI